MCITLPCGCAYTTIKATNEPAPSNNVCASPCHVVCMTQPSKLQMSQHQVTMYVHHPAMRCAYTTIKATNEPAPSNNVCASPGHVVCMSTTIKATNEPAPSNNVCTSPCHVVCIQQPSKLQMSQHQVTMYVHHPAMRCAYPATTIKATNEPAPSNNVCASPGHVGVHTQPSKLQMSQHQVTMYVHHPAMWCAYTTIKATNEPAPSNNVCNNVCASPGHVVCA